MLDEVALLLAHGVVFDRAFAVLPSLDTGLDAASGECFAEPAAVITTIGDQDIGLGQCGKHRCHSTIVADLAFGQEQGLAVAVADGVKLGVQAALGASNATGNSPFLSRLAAV